MNKTVLTIIIIVLFSLYSLALWFSALEIGKSKAKIKILTETKTEYSDVRDTVVIPKFYTQTHTDSIITHDTTYIKETTNYIAEIDTAYEDGLAKLRVSYISDIPLSPRSYFDIDLRVEKEIQFVPTYKQNSFWTNRFIFYTGIGISYGIDSRLIEPAIQVGVGIRIY